MGSVISRFVSGTPEVEFDESQTTLPTPTDKSARKLSHLLKANLVSFNLIIPDETDPNSYKWNNTTSILLSYYFLGASSHQLLRVYNHIHSLAVPWREDDLFEIWRQNWKDHFGEPGCSRAYKDFFSDELFYEKSYDWLDGVHEFLYRDDSFIPGFFGDGGRALQSLGDFFTLESLELGVECFARAALLCPPMRSPLYTGLVEIAEPEHARERRRRIETGMRSRKADYSDTRPLLSALNRLRQDPATLGLPTTVGDTAEFAVAHKEILMPYLATCCGADYTFYVAATEGIIQAVLCILFSPELPEAGREVFAHLLNSAVGLYRAISTVHDENNKACDRIHFDIQENLIRLTALNVVVAYVAQGFPDISSGVPGGDWRCEVTSEAALDEAWVPEFARFLSAESAEEADLLRVRTFESLFFCYRNFSVDLLPYAKLFLSWQEK